MLIFVISAVEMYHKITRVHHDCISMHAKHIITFQNTTIADKRLFINLKVQHTAKAHLGMGKTKVSKIKVHRHGNTTKPNPEIIFS